jgi:N utilization substance protein A
MLVDREIEVWREAAKGEIIEDEEDVALDDFTDPEYGATIDGWIIEKLKSIGCDTAKSVLAIDPDELAKRADLEDETVEEVRRILAAEFEE